MESPEAYNFWNPRPKDVGQAYVVDKDIFFARERSQEDRRLFRTTLENSRGKIVSLPKLDLMALDRVKYSVLIEQWIPEYNTHIPLEDWTPESAYHVWAGIVLNVFHFESEPRKQKALNEVRYTWRSHTAITNSNPVLRQTQAILRAYGSFGASLLPTNTDTRLSPCT